VKSGRSCPGRTHLFPAGSNGPTAGHGQNLSHGRAPRGKSGGERAKRCPAAGSEGKHGNDPVSPWAVRAGGGWEGLQAPLHSFPCGPLERLIETSVFAKVFIICCGPIPVYEPSQTNKKEVLGIL